jgi:hypothetical protein
MSNPQTPVWVGLLPLILIVALLGGGYLYMRRRGYTDDGARTIVRCRNGHLFTTIWIPGASFKAVRLGALRIQYCPVGNHWTIVTPVKPEDLTDDELEFARSHHDSNLP